MKPRRLWTAAALVLALGATVSSQTRTAPPRLTLAEAQQLIDAVHQAATGMGLRLGVAVVDSRGDLIALGRMAGAGANTPDTAIGKAMMSAIYGQPSGALAARATSPVTQAWNEATGGRLRFIPGAVPIVRNGMILGAVGASGASSQQDEQAVIAGMKALP